MSTQTASLIQYLKNTLPAQAVPLVLASLRQDPVVWQSLQAPEFLDKFCSQVTAQGRAQLTDWSPARLALTALNQPYRETQLPGEYPPELLEQVTRGYPGLIENQEELDLARAGTIALALTERNRQSGSWSFLAGEIEQHASFPWESAVACMLGLVVDPLTMLGELTSQQPSTLRSRLAIHAILSHPAETSSRIDALMAITHGSQSHFPTQPLEMLDFLHILNNQAPELAAAYCRMLNAEQIAISHIPAAQPFHQADLLRETAVTLRDLEIARLAGDKSKENILLDKLLAMRNILAASLLTQVTAMRPVDREDTLTNAHLVANWKKAIELLQSVQPASVIDPFKAGLAQALMQAGKSADAHAVLANNKQGLADDAYQLIPLILTAHQNGNDALAQQAGAHLAEIYPSHKPGYGYIAPHAALDPIQIADHLRTIGMPAEAMRVLENVLHQSPTQGSWLRKLVELQAADNLFPQAAENMQILAGLYPEDLQLRHKMARTYEAYQNWASALDEWISLLEDTQYPNQAEELEDLHALAACALNARQPNPAIHASQRALSLMDEDGLAYTTLGQAYAMQRDFIRGLEYVTKATQISPTLPQGWLALADLLSQQDRCNQAIESLQTAIQIIPNNAQLLFALGELHLRVGNPTVAVSALKQAVSLDPAQTRYHYTLGMALNRLGHTGEALHELGSAYQADEENIDFASAYGAALLDAGDSRAALQPLTTATQSRHTATPLTYVNYARAMLDLYQQGDSTLSSATALEAVECALTRDPDLPEAKGWHAEALRATGNLPAAFTAYQEALETQLTNNHTWRERLSYGMGKTAHQLGRFDIAIASAQEAISAAPKNPENYKLLAGAYLDSSLFEDSLRSARTVLNLNIDNLTNLAWYADHIARLVAHHHAMLSTNLSNQTKQAVLEAQNALLQAVQLAPQRADLLVKLSKLQQMTGDNSAALETTKLVLNNDNASVEHLSEAADQMQSLGDIGSAISCLEKAIARDQSSTHNTTSYLLARLAHAYVEKGDLISASEALEQAISIAPDMGSLYYERTSLLLNLARTEDAFCCVETGISLARTDPSLPRLYILAAWLYRLNGDLASALGYIHKGLEANQHLSTASVSNHSSLPLDDRMLIADIYRASLQPQKAYQMLKPEPDDHSSENSPADSIRQWIGLKTELELELGYVPDSILTEHPQGETTPLFSGWLALQARLAIRNGSTEQADKYYQSAIRLAQEENAAKGSHTGLGRATARRSLVSLLESALDFNDWHYAQGSIDQIAEIAPNEPYTHLAVARLIIMQAEFQLACSRLEVQQHAPGITALSVEKKAALENAIRQASALIQLIEKNNPDYDLGNPITRLERWHSRGQIAFYRNAPQADDPSQLSAAIARLKLNPAAQSQTAEEAAAVISAAQLNGRQGAENTILAEVLQITRPHSRNPWVWFHAALALEIPYPREAFGAARGATQLLPSKQGPLAALDHALLARIAQQLNDLTTAQEAIEAALALWPDEARWHVLAAQIDQSAHHPASGLKHLEHAAQLEPTAMTIHLELGKAYLADSSQNAGGVNRAIQCFDTAVHLDPGEVTAWIWLARAQLRAKEIEAAIKSVEQILSIAPDNTEAAVLQAEIALQRKSYQAAHTFAQSAVQASPEDPKTTLLLAKTLKSLNRPAEALQVLESALPISQDPLELQYERAKLLHELRGPDAALQVLTELVAKYPDDANILTSLARSQADLGDLQAATQTALAALKAGKIGLEPAELAHIHFLTGTLLRRSGQLDQAIQQLNDAVTLAPDCLESYLELGLARKERREYQQALQAFEQATKIAPHDPRPHYLAGLALKEGKDYRRSEVMLRQAAHLAPDDVLVRRQLAQVVALNVVHNPRT
jgi:tetratricopeptide (TPR) repeat protein